MAERKMTGSEMVFKAVKGRSRVDDAIPWEALLRTASLRRRARSGRSRELTPDRLPHWRRRTGEVRVGGFVNLRKKWPSWRRSALSAGVGRLRPVGRETPLLLENLEVCSGRERARCKLLALVWGDEELPRQEVMRDVRTRAAT